MARLAYLGTPDLSVPPLHALVDAGHQVALVVTRPDRRRGRGAATAPSPVKAAARALGIPVSERAADVAGAGVELGVVVAYGRIIPADVLAAVPMVNLHFSLLPRWRGAAPVERAILAGDEVTGVCVMSVAEGLDTGDIYGYTTVPIGGSDLAELRHRLVDEGSRLLVSLLSGGLAGLPEPTPQRGEPSYAEKIRPEELEIDWTRPAAQIARLVRLGRAFTWFRGRRLRVLGAAASDPGAADATGGTSAPPPGSVSGDRVAAGSGWLVLTRVQPEGGRPMAAEEWGRGTRPEAGERLGRH